MNTAEIIKSMMAGEPIVPLPQESLKTTLNEEYYYVHEEAVSKEATWNFMEKVFSKLLSDKRASSQHVYIIMQIPEKRVLNENELDQLNSFIYGLSLKVSALNVTWGLNANPTIQNMNIHFVAAGKNVKTTESSKEEHTEKKNWRKVCMSIVIAVLAFTASISLMTYGGEDMPNGVNFSFFLQELLLHSFNSYTFCSLGCWCIGAFTLLYNFWPTIFNHKNIKIRSI